MTLRTTSPRRWIRLDWFGLRSRVVVAGVTHIPVQSDAAHCAESVCRHCLGSHPATGGILSEAEKSRIHQYRKRLRFGARKTICAEGNAPPFFIGNLISGVVKLAFSGVPGEVSALLFPGDFLGPFDDSVAVTCTASALLDCELCCFEGAGLHKVFVRHPRLQEGFLQHFADAVERARKDAAKLRRPQAVARVAALLQIFAERADDNAADNVETGADDGAGEVQLPLSRAEIALLLGLTPETVSRCMSQMRHDGIIRPLPNRAMVIKKPAQLKALAQN